MSSERDLVVLQSERVFETIETCIPILKNGLVEYTQVVILRLMLSLLRKFRSDVLRIIAWTLFQTRNLPPVCLNMKLYEAHFLTSFQLLMLKLMTSV